MVSAIPLSVQTYFGTLSNVEKFFRKEIINTPFLGCQNCSPFSAKLINKYKNAYDAFACYCTGEKAKIF